MYPIYLHEMGELEIIQRLVAGILDNKIVVDTNTRINSENDKISIFDLSKKKIIKISLNVTSFSD